MKKYFFIFFLAVIILSSVNAAGIRQERMEQEIKGIEWKLIEVHIDGADTQFRRSSLPADMSALFTINFDGQTLNGTGAPNLYSAPYTTGKNQTISILNIRSTLMASLFEPEKLSEHNFFTYVQNSYSWRISSERMELLSKTTDERIVRLVFNKYGGLGL